MEEGEILPDNAASTTADSHGTFDDRDEPHGQRSSLVTSGAIYSPSVEWPGEMEPTWAAQTPEIMQGSHTDHTPIGLNGSDLHAQTPVSLRLVVQKTAILPKRQRLAVLDGFTEVQFGRDHPLPGSDTPRIRLKEMDVSKLHATVYWDKEREEWAVVDMGSKHGTFLQPSSGSAASASTPESVKASLTGGPSDKGTRLSEPRRASIPRRLRHLDCLNIGTTTFVIHIHADCIPCVECSREDGREIPLFDTRNAGGDCDSDRKRKLDSLAASVTHDYVSRPERDPKRALSSLRRSLLSRHVTSMAAETGSQYLDRSARRRALCPDAPPEPSQLHPARGLIPSSISQPISRAHSPWTPAVTHSVSAPPTPLPESNIGHRLLMKQGWSPGTSLGQAESRDIALIEPLDVIGNTRRAGLGMSKLVDAPPPAGPSTDWKEEGKRRRWA